MSDGQWTTKKRLINIIKNHNEDKKKVAELISVVVQTGGISYAEKKMNEYYQRANTILDTFPSNQYSVGLKELIKYTIEREK